jgi:hypothetical protein
MIRGRSPGYFSNARCTTIYVCVRDIAQVSDVLIPVYSIKAVKVVRIGTK